MFSLSGDNRQCFSRESTHRHSKVVVGSTRAKIKNQLAAIQALKESLPDTPEAGSGVRPLENVEEELQGEKPDPKRIEKWLETANHGLKSLAFTKEVSDAAKVAWDAF